MILDRMFKRASIESPSTPLSEAYDLLTTGEKVKSGVTVDQNSVMGIPAFWKGVNLISRAVGKAKITIKKTSGKTKVPDKKHPLWYLLRKCPTGKFVDAPITPFIFKQTLQSQVLTHGNGYAYIIRDQYKVPIGLVWLDPNAVVPVKETDTDKGTNGLLTYLVTVADGGIRRVKYEDILHIKGLSYNGLLGHSVIEVLKDAIGLNIAYQDNQSIFFKNSMRPGWIIEVPWRFRDDDAVADFRRKMGQIHQGIERSHIPAILEHGAKASPLNISHEDAQFIQSREFDLRMLANIFFLPSSKLNDVAKIAYNSLEQEGQSVLSEGYEPWFIVWEEELEYKLLSETEKENDSHEIVFDTKRLVHTPYSERMEGYNKSLLSGWMNRDEVREEEGLNPMPDGEGQKSYMPVNVMIAGEEQQKEQDEDVITDYRIEKARTVAFDQLKESAKRLFNSRIMSAGKRTSYDPKKFMTWVLDELFDNRDIFVEALDPKIVMLKLLENESTDTRTEVVVDEYLLNLKEELNRIAGMVSPGELITEVERFLVFHEDKVNDFVTQLIEKG